ncbi:hypothetical protein C0J52_19450 [Blattella germanica]|nr:hypothetical protein C0J52_19450 [Blattella germanica]
MPKRKQRINEREKMAAAAAAKRIARERETPEEREVRLARRREYDRVCLRLAKYREYRRVCRENESEEQRKARLLRQRLHIARKKQTLKGRLRQIAFARMKREQDIKIEERDTALHQEFIWTPVIAAACAAKRIARERETEEEREVRLAKYREYRRVCRENESEEQRKARLLRQRLHIARKKQTLKEEREVRLAKRREYARVRRENESEEQRKARLLRQRLHIAGKKQTLKRRLRQIAFARMKREEDIKIEERDIALHQEFIWTSCSTDEISDDNDFSNLEETVSSGKRFHRILNVQAQKLICQVYQHLQKGKPGRGALCETAKFVGVCRQTVAKIVCRGPTPPKTPGPKKKPFCKLDKCSREKIHRIISDFCESGVPIASPNLLKKLQIECGFPYGKTMLADLMKELGFRYKIGPSSILQKRSPNTQ